MSDTARTPRRRSERRALGQRRPRPSRTRRAGAKTRRQRACHSTSPAVAAADRRNPRPRSPRIGEQHAVTATHSAFAVAARRPEARPHDATEAMSAARITLGASPTSTLYVTMRRRSPLHAPPTRARPQRERDRGATSVMLKPGSQADGRATDANALFSSAESPALASTIPSRCSLWLRHEMRSGRARSAAARTDKSARDLRRHRTEHKPRVTPTAAAHAHDHSDRRGPSALAMPSRARTALIAPSANASCTATSAASAIAAARGPWRSGAITGAHVNA